MQATHAVQFQCWPLLGAVCSCRLQASVASPPFQWHAGASDGILQLLFTHYSDRSHSYISWDSYKIRRTLSTNDPPRSLKILQLVALSACRCGEGYRKPFFSARDVLMRIVLVPFLLLVRFGGVSNLHIVWSMLTICDGTKEGV